MELCKDRYFVLIIKAFLKEFKKKPSESPTSLRQENVGDFVGDSENKEIKRRIS